MKKNNNKVVGKNEKRLKKILILSALIVVLSFLSFFFFGKSVNNKTRIDFNYGEQGNINYKVYLKNNKFYDKDYLEEGMQYISGLIKNIGIDFGYSINSDKEADYNYRYSINAKVVVTEKNNSSSVLYTKEENLYNSKVMGEKETNGFNLKDDLSINYNKYNKIVEDFKNEYSLSVDGNLIITINVYTDVRKIKSIEDFSKANSMSITIPLAKNTIDITTTSINSNGNAYAMSNKEIINIVLFITYLVVTLTDIWAMVYLYLIIRKMLLESTTPYMRKLKKIMREYDRVIVETTKKPKLEKYNVIEVKNFEELVDARDSVNNVILYLDIIPGEECWFVLIHEEKMYRYILNAEGIK